jgi:uncharacterized protein with FMN-binding domain
MTRISLPRFRRALAVGVLLPWALAALPAAEPAPRLTLQQAQAQLQIPPAWFAATPIQWDTNKPWKDARLEIRRLLALDEASVRQGVKLTWLHAQKRDIGDGHELPMYLFMSGNYAWATLEYPNYIKTVAGKGATHAFLCYASCLAHFGEYAQALAVLADAEKDLPPEPWRISSRANIHNHYGDVHAKMGDHPKAKEHYLEAIRLYPTSTQPYGRHLLPRYVAKVQTKLDLLTLQNLQNTRLRDGVYLGRALGYSDKKDLEVTVSIRAGRIADVTVKHEEKIDLNATTLIPQRIVAQQNLNIDGITGATVTSQGIVDGAFQALKQAGLK